MFERVVLTKIGRHTEIGGADKVLEMFHAGQQTMRLVGDTNTTSSVALPVCETDDTSIVFGHLGSMQEVLMETAATSSSSSVQHTGIGVVFMRIGKDLMVCFPFNNMSTSNGDTMWASRRAYTENLVTKHAQPLKRFLETLRSYHERRQRRNAATRSPEAP